MFVGDWYTTNTEEETMELEKAHFYEGLWSFMEKIFKAKTKYENRKKKKHQVIFYRL